jgi:hypothetical protein
VSGRAEWKQKETKVKMKQEEQETRVSQKTGVGDENEKRNKKLVRQDGMETRCWRRRE